jgi:hypothetical protein
MMRRSLTALLAAAAACGIGATAVAQIPAPAAPHTPDLLGLYTGMPEAQARVALQKHSNTVNVQSNAHPEVGFGLHITDPRNPDQIDVYLTDAPNDPYVWMVQRTQTYSGRDGTPMSLDTVLGALRQKYGKETMTADRGPGGLYVYWLFDASGKLLSAGDTGLQGCDANMIVTYMGSGVPKGAAQVNAACYKTFFAIKAMFNRATPPLLNSYSVELVNLPMAFTAATRTGDAKAAGDARGRQDEVNRANGNRPTF